MFKFLCIFVAILTVQASQRHLDDDIQSLKLQDGLVSLGEINGRTFFYENTDRNWFDSLKLCEDSGLTLAELRDQEDVDFLKSKRVPDAFEGGYWIGGRDAPIPDQFIWSHSQTKINPILQWTNHGGPRTCVYMFISPVFDQNGKILPLECNSGFGRAICQSV